MNDSMPNSLNIRESLSSIILQSDLTNLPLDQIITALDIKLTINPLYKEYNLATYITEAITSGLSKLVDSLFPEFCEQNPKLTSESFRVYADEKRIKVFNPLIEQIDRREKLYYIETSEIKIEVDNNKAIQKNRESDKEKIINAFNLLMYKRYKRAYDLLSLSPKITTSLFKPELISYLNEKEVFEVVKVNV